MIPSLMNSITLRIDSLVGRSRYAAEKASNSHFEKISLRERFSSREQSWTDATHTVSGNKPKRIMKIVEKNLAMSQKIAYDQA